MNQKIRIWLRNFFGFSRTETNGFIIMIILMIVILAAPFISKKLYTFNKRSIQSKTDQSQLNLLLSKLESSVEYKKENKKEKDFKPFDLNTSEVQDLMNSGLPKYLAERIIKYRNKVKPFDSKSELLKIYGLDSSFYKEIYPYIRVSKIKSKAISTSEPAIKEKVISKKEVLPDKGIGKAKIQPFDINKADSIQLQQVFGIGPTYSKRITKYRDYLGGFHSIRQLEEVYGLKKENLDSLKKYIYIQDKNNIKQLKVNKLNVDSLVQHPYISYKEANLIVNYRKQHGGYNSSKDLLSIKVLDSSWVKKVTPYFNFD